MAIGLGQRLKILGKMSAAIMASLLPPTTGRLELADAIGYVENAGVPTSIVPDFIGQLLFDTTNSTFYLAYGTSSGNWWPIAPGIVNATYANLIATTGRIQRASNLGANGSLIEYNGTRFRPVNGVAVLATLGAPVASIANTETIVLQTLIPAGAWQTNDSLRLFIALNKSGTTDTLAFKVRIGTAGTTADAAVRTATILAAGSQSGGFISDVKLISATSAQPVGTANQASTGYGLGGSAASIAAVTITDASANALYMTVTIQSSSTNDTVGMSSGQISLVTP